MVLGHDEEINMKKLIHVEAVVLLLGALLSACSSTTSYSLLDKSSCTLPCWNNIVLYETTKEELLNIISSLEHVDQGSITEIESLSRIYDQVVRFEIKPGQKSDDPINIEISIQNNKVNMLVFSGQLGVTLGKIVLETGEPKNLLTVTLPGGYREIVMLNQAKGLAFGHGSYETDINVEAENTINLLIVFASENYEELLEEGVFFLSAYKKDDTLRIMYPWDGYGNLDEKYPPRQP